MKVRPLRRSITIVCIVFFVVLAAILSLTTYGVFTTAMNNRYNKQMTSIADYIQSKLDNEDMAICARTYEESETYKEFQTFLNEMADGYTDVNNMYLIQVLEPGNSPRIVELCAGFTSWERNYDPDSLLYLGDRGEDWFSDEMEDKFYEIQKGYKDAFLRDPSKWGDDYTLARPLISEAGDHYGLLCVDVSYEEINSTVYINVYINIGVIVGCALLFIIMFLRWLRAYIVSPLGILEKSVIDYAESAEGKREPADLLYTVPELGVNNEVRTLAEEVRKLSICMRDYVQQVLNAQKETRGLKEQILQDPLTLVKSKAAYNLEEEVLQESIDEGKAEFAILMADMNNLKLINDKYGHEKGNVYIVGGCQMICEIYDHSPVYRVGGDEFVVVLRGRDYERRNELLKTLKEKVWSSMNDESLSPWERYSVAAGMSEYEDGDDVDSVLRRADQAMYKEKIRIKTAAGMPLTRNEKK